MQAPTTVRDKLLIYNVPAAVANFGPVLWEREKGKTAPPCYYPQR